MDEVQEAHRSYLAATALERPGLQWTSSAATKFPQVERSIRPLIIKTAPKYIQDQLLARGDISVMRAVLEMCIEAAPGGLEDKGTVLSVLQFPRVAGSSIEALRTLRQWRQNWLRTDELRINRPDASLMLVGLKSVIRKVEQQSPEFKFRCSTFQHDAGLPHAVTEEKRLRFWEYLLGEIREQAAGA